MHLKVYLIRGRGEGGNFFQVAGVLDKEGNRYLDAIEQSKVYGSLEEFKLDFAKAINVSAEEIHLVEGNIFED